jgi:membrane protease YdiL (CAAX protease family)
MSDIQDVPEVRAQSAKHPLLIAALTTLLVTAFSYLLPESVSATCVGLTFLAVTYFLVVRGDDVAKIRHFGLSLGGLLEPEPLSARHIGRETSRALGFALLIGVIIFPAFWFGFVKWWQVQGPFRPAPVLPGLLDEALGQLLMIALPEEAFYRGYLQTSLDDVWKARVRVLGAELGPSILVTSALFALGHFMTEVHPNRLAVFFPALVFGWLRARSGGIGASVLFHAMCNLFASYLTRSYFH